jgi:hypothetical protein
MPRSAGNPYPVNSPEHSIWERWHQGFFAEPVHSQLYAIEADLRRAMTEVMQITGQIAVASLRTNIRSRLLQIEEGLLLLEEAADHAYQRVVTTSAVPDDPYTAEMETDGSEAD